MKKAITVSKSTILFHLAAQPLILDSYKKPHLTYTVNTIGTLNILETVRETNSVKSLICITSDKCYESNFSIKGAATAGQQLISLHNPATSGTVYFMAFGTEASYSERGYITYDQTNIAFTQASDIKLKKNII